MPGLNADTTQCVATTSCPSGVREPHQVQGERDAARIARLQIDYVHDRRFDDSDTVHSLLESLPELSAQDSAVSVTQERHLFLKMNCLRFLAAQRQRSALQRGVRPTDLRTIRNLLQQAIAVRNEIALLYQRLVYSIVGRLNANPLETDDLVSEAAVVLLRAIDKFDVSRGFRFSTYATHSVRRHLHRVLQRVRRTAPIVGDHLVEPAVDSSEADWIDVHPGEVVSCVLAEMPVRERRMVELRFGLLGDGRALTYQDIAAEFGMSSEYVRQLVIRSCAKARQTIAQQFGF